MKAHAISDDANRGRSQADAGRRDDRRRSELAGLHARIDELEKQIQERESLREQAEQALALTRRQFTKLLEESAPLRLAAMATNSNLLAFEADLERAEGGLAQTRHQLAVTESALRQKQEENSQAWSEVTSNRDTIAEMEQALEFERRSKLTIAMELAESNSWAFRLAGEKRHAEVLLSTAERALERERRARDRAEQETGAARSRAELLMQELRETERGRKIAEERRDEAYDEIVAVTRFLRASEAIANERETRLVWLARVTTIMSSKGPWWSYFVPRQWSHQWFLRRLADEQLFDAKAYLRRNPDIGAAGQDPLRHYINHGMAEGRQI